MLSAAEANRIANQCYSNHKDAIMKDLEHRIRERASRGYKWMSCNFDYYFDFCLSLEDCSQILFELRNAGYDLKKDFTTLGEKRRYIIRW